MPKIALDAIDRKILAALQRNARLTNVELANEVGLSASPCLRRVRLLEEAGVIGRYHAALDRKELGLGLTAFVGVKVERHHGAAPDEFSDAIRHVPEIIACHLVSGDADFLLEIAVSDLAAYEKLLVGTLLNLPGVKDIRSNFAIRTLKETSPLPLEHLPR